MGRLRLLARFHGGKILPRQDDAAREGRIVGSLLHCVNAPGRDAGHMLLQHLTSFAGGRTLWSRRVDARSEEHTSELQSLMRISYAVFCLKKKNTINSRHTQHKNPQRNTAK